MVLDAARSRRRRLGLDRDQFRRRRRADGIPGPRQGRPRPLRRRHLARQRRPPDRPRPRRHSLRPAPPLALAGDRRGLSGRSRFPGPSPRGRTPHRPEADVRRPGTGWPRPWHARLLGRRRHRARRPRLSRAHRLRRWPQTREAFHTPGRRGSRSFRSLPRSIASAGCRPGSSRSRPAPCRISGSHRGGYIRSA